MNNKTTKELTDILENSRPSEIEQFLKNHEKNLLLDDKAFCNYMHIMLNKYCKTQQEVFLQADIPERFGYKLISQEKHTKQRDYILRICYSIGMTLEETQRALTIYGMGQLYARVPRDAVLMIAFNQRPGSIQDVNALLISHDLDVLKSSGSLE